MTSVGYHKSLMKESEVFLSRNKLLDDIIIQTKQCNTNQTVKQKKIIDAASKLFAEKGYSNTSTAEIAKLAEVSEGTIFKHYGTKDKLLLSLIVPYLKECIPSIVDEVFNETMNDSITTFEEFLRAFLKNRKQFISENKEIFQIIVKEMIYTEKLKNELFPLLYENGASRFNKVIELFKERGELIAMPSERILKMLLTFIGGFFATNYVLLNRQTISDDEMEDVICFVMHGIGK